MTDSGRFPDDSQDLLPRVNERDPAPDPAIPAPGRAISRTYLTRATCGEPLRLLVSVRNAEEALIACASGAEVIDVKEPARGALGRADDGALRAVVDAVRGRAVLSFAAGEATDRANSSAGPDCGYSFFKYGPAGLALLTDWRSVLAQAWRTGPSAASPVAVAYVDYEAASAPSPEAIVELAIDRGCAGMLFDTCGKEPRLGLTALPEARLRECIGRAREERLFVALAGSLGPDDAADVHRLEADLIAVRGAVCTKDRSGPIDASRIAALKNAILRVTAMSDESDAQAIVACAEGRTSRRDRS